MAASKRFELLLKDSNSSVLPIILRGCVTLLFEGKVPFLKHVTSNGVLPLCSFECSAHSRILEVFYLLNFTCCHVR